MPVKRCTLKGRKISSLNDLYDQLATGLSLPSHFGHNLDALRDVLANDVEGPFEITWEDANLSKKAMKKNFERVIRLFKDLEDDRGDFTLKIEK